MSDSVPINDGGPAFPTHLEDQFIQIPSGEMGRASEYGWESKPGMSLRDYFAAKAMQGMLNGAVGFIGSDQNPSPYAHGPCNDGIAERAYAIADAMLAARGGAS